MEQYGGDDVREPNPKSPSHAPAEESVEDQKPFVTWDSDDDPSNPQNWSTKYKWAITLLCALMTVNVYVFARTNVNAHLLNSFLSTFASSAPSSATSRVVEEFQISQEVGYLITSLFLFGYVFGVSGYLVRLYFSPLTRF